MTSVSSFLLTFSSMSHAQIMGFFVFHDNKRWPGALALPALIDLFQIVLLLFCPESPVWLMHTKYAEEKAAGGTSLISIKISGEKLESKHMQGQTREILNFYYITLTDNINSIYITGAT